MKHQNFCYQPYFPADSNYSEIRDLQFANLNFKLISGWISIVRAQSAQPTIDCPLSAWGYISRHNDPRRLRARAAGCRRCACSVRLVCPLDGEGWGESRRGSHDPNNNTLSNRSLTIYWISGRCRPTTNDVYCRISRVKPIFACCHINKKNDLLPAFCI